MNTMHRIQTSNVWDTQLCTAAIEQHSEHNGSYLDFFLLLVEDNSCDYVLKDTESNMTKTAL